jgi:exopolysaccharide biosynthesis protein
MAAGPININILKVPKSANLSFGLAQDKVSARETLSSIAKRKGALAAVNADYFSFKPGGPSGVMVDESIIFSSPINNRSYLGILPGNSYYVDRVAMAATITPAATGKTGIISWINKTRESGSETIFVFSPLFGESTLTEDTGTEVTIRLNGPIAPNKEIEGTVVDVRYGSGNGPIPPDCVVLSSATGSGCAYLNANMVLGDAVKLKFSLEPNWQETTRAIGGGPRLVRGGQANVENEAFTSEQIKGRNARTGIGIDANGNLIVCVVDGKRDFFSIGMSLYELAADLKNRGAVDAMAFDSGGSSTLYFNGAVRNYPTDGAERPISNALLFMP